MIKPFNNHYTPNKKNLLFYLILLSLLFFIWQILFIILINSNSSFIVTSILFHKKINFPIKMLPADIIFFCIHIGLYILFAFIIWIIALLAGQYLKLSWKKTERFAFILWLISILGVIFANQLLYPISVFSNLFNAVFPHTIAISLLSLILVLLIITAILVLLQLLQLIWHSHRIIKILVITFLAVLLLFVIDCIFLPIVLLPKQSHTSIVFKHKPNIIIIGLDALRPDHVGYYGYHLDNTPHLDHILKRSVNFKSSITPLARTFPAWVSILTGQYPKHDHVRFNLVNQTHLHLHYTLPAILKRHGYQTIYATDDRRFSNVGKNFGFDQIVGIKAGANDFLLGSFNDFLLSNLLINTPIGEVLFPYSFGNRAAQATYNPKSFIDILSQNLNQLQKKPLFLCVHFCLPHWPYIWAKSKQDISNHSSNVHLYDLAINRVDKQFAAFLKLLHKHQLLKNAMVVIISDHGEAFGMPGDRMIAKKNYIKGRFSHQNIFKEMEPLLIPKNKKHFILNTSIGHGTDILSFKQYHTILAFRGFGHYFPPHNVHGLVSLIDIKPTILSMLNLPSEDTDGRSLFSEIKSQKKLLKPKPVFVETGFTPNAIKSSHFSVRNVVYSAVDLFYINPKTLHIIMKPSAIKHLMKLKQYAVYYKNWLLASYPTLDDGIVHILVNRKTHQWTDDLHTFFAKKAPLFFLQ